MVTVHVFATNGAETSGPSNTVTGFSSEEGVYSCITEFHKKTLIETKS